MVPVNFETCGVGSTVGEAQTVVAGQEAQRAGTLGDTEQRGVAHAREVFFFMSDTVHHSSSRPTPEIRTGDAP